MADKKEVLWKNWKTLVNMSVNQLEKFLDSEEGSEAGLSKKEASKLDISRGRDSARAIIRMKRSASSFKQALEKWSDNDWDWAQKQVSFISRMKAVKGRYSDDKGGKSRLLLSLLIWGHDPRKYKKTWSESDSTMVSANFSTGEPGVRSFIVKKVKNKTKKFAQYFREIIPLDIKNQ